MTCTGGSVNPGRYNAQCVPTAGWLGKVRPCIRGRARGDVDRAGPRRARFVRRGPGQALPTAVGVRVHVSGRAWTGWSACYGSW